MGGVTERELNAKKCEKLVKHYRSVIKLCNFRLWGCIVTAR